MPGGRVGRRAVAKMDRFELVSIHTSHPVPRDPSAAALGVDGRPRQILIILEMIRGGKGLKYECLTALQW